MECWPALCLKTLISQSDVRVLIQSHSIHDMEYGVFPFFSNTACQSHLSIYVSVNPFVSLRLQALILEKDNLHLPHCLERCEILWLAEWFSFLFSKAGFFPESWIEKGKLDYLSFTLTPFQNPTVAWGKTRRQYQWLSWIYLIYLGRLTWNLFWRK